MNNSHSRYDEQESKNVVSFKKALIMYVSVSLFLFFEMALQVSPSVISFQLMHDLNISSFGLGLMSGCYFYTYTAMQIPSGILLDRYNPRIIITLALSICSLGALLFSISSNLTLAIIARLFMGIGSAFAFVSVLIVTRDLFKSKYFATLTGITQMLAAFGAMSGQLPINYLINIFGWRTTLLFFTVIGFTLALFIFCFLHYKRQKNINPNHKVQYQLSDFRKVIMNREAWFIGLYACLLWAPISGFASLWGVPFLIENNEFSTNQATFVCSLMWLGLAIASPLLGLFSTTINCRKIPLVVAPLIGAIAFWILVFNQLNVYWSAIVIFIGGAACAGQALSFAVVQESNSEPVQATALAFNNMAVVISGAVVQPLIGWILHIFHGTLKQQFHYASLIILAAYIGALILAIFFIKESLIKVKSLTHNQGVFLDNQRNTAL